MTGPTSHAENGTTRTANYLVGIGSQPAERALNHASSDDEKIRPVFGHGPRNAVDQSNVLHNLKRDRHSSPLTVTRKILARLIDQEGMSSIRGAAWKAGVDARYRMHDVKRRAEVAAELDCGL